MRYLISILGLSDYKTVEVRIPWNDQNSEVLTDKYHQRPLAKEIGADHLWLIGTPEALCKQSELCLDSQEQIEIPKGIGESEVWEIANKVTQKLESLLPMEGTHEIHLDLTHGFRTQPMVVLSAVQYFCSLHSDKFTLQEIYYNCYENEQPYSTLVQMQTLLAMQAVGSEIDLLLDYSVAAPLVKRLGELERFESAELLSGIDSKNLTKAGKDREIRKLLDQNPILSTLRSLVKELESFSSMVGINHTPSAARVVQQLCIHAEKARHEFSQETKMLPYVGQALGVMRDRLKDLLPKDANPLWGWHIALSKWCLERGLLQQAITHANEVILTRCCEEKGLEPLDSANRTACAKALRAMVPPKECPTQWTELLGDADRVREHRNKVNHSFTSSTPNSDPKIERKKIREAVQELLQRVEKASPWPDFTPDFSAQDSAESTAVL